MTELQKRSLVNRAVRLKDFFEIDLTISMFGKVIFSWHFPPLKNKPLNDLDDE